MKPAILYPLAFLAIVGLLLWKPWRDGSSAGPPPTDVAERSAPAAEPEPEPNPEEPVYEFREAGPGGTGKFYMGREIAQVMGHEAMFWLERESREAEEAPSRAIAALDLDPAAVVADIGAGSGYYTFRLAKLVPEGEVVAIDIQPEMLARLESRADQLGAGNVRAHRGTVSDIGLDPGSIDATLMVDAYHEFSHPAEMMDSIVEALRPGGRVFLLEYRAEDESVPIKPLHKMSADQAREEMAAAGLEFVANHDFLPWQHFLVFRKPEA